MSSVLTKLVELGKSGKTGYWGERILAEIGYAWKLSQVQGGRYDEAVIQAGEFVLEQYEQSSAITEDTGRRAESMLDVLRDAAKSYKMICASHAHIDMNWMWGWPETVSITLDTFRTMLHLMDEYPEFTFSQSQASVYRIVEDYAPEMLPEIKERIHEGRWEITASTWVEADKNMPNGESMARHLLYTKQYLSQLFDIPSESLDFDFEPDTFGHSANVPEILSKGGVKHYYHCRGYNTDYESHNIYRWIAPSGRAVTVYREPLWYNATIDAMIGLYVPEFCQTYGMDTMLKVYGVGDHGGGPTRRDIEKLQDMNTWPIYPSIRFGTFREYFALVDKVNDSLPTVEGELNPVFTGCYTSQSRIKLANRMGEAALNEAELFAAAAALATGANYPAEAFANAWKDILFNQFHDIIPGSGVTETREYAMGLFQQAMATANSRKRLALQSLADQVDTSQYKDDEDTSSTVSEGAGVGYGVQDFQVSQVERGRGKTRLFHVFNPSAQARKEAVKLVVWDWNGDLSRMVLKDTEGQVLTHQVLQHGTSHYWGHTYIEVMTQVAVPSLGYSTVVLEESQEYKDALQFPRDPRVESPDGYVLENEHLRVVFDPQTAAIQSWVDNASGEELACPNRPTGVFRYIEEDDSKGMTSWQVGRYMQVKNLTDRVKIKGLKRGPVRQTFSYETAFLSSRLKVEISLDVDARTLTYNVECDWQEVGVPGQLIPQLGFYLPLPYPCGKYKQDIPFGTIDREPVEMDMVANSWSASLRDGKPAVMLVTDTKHGFRCVDDSMAITLIRSSSDPDPYPEFGKHRFKFGVALVEQTTNQDLIDYGASFNHPLTALSGRIQEGHLPLSMSFGAVESGHVAVSAIKMPESGNSSAVVVRLYETENAPTKAVLNFAKPCVRAQVVDVNEQPTADGVEISGRTVSVDVPASSVVTVELEF